MVEGRVKWFSDQSGSGFIVLSNGDEILVHYKDIIGDGFKSLNAGDNVRLMVEESERGPVARQVKRL